MCPGPTWVWVAFYVFPRRYAHDRMHQAPSLTRARLPTARPARAPGLPPVPREAPTPHADVLPPRTEGHLTLNQRFTHLNVRLMLAPEDRAVSVIGGILMDTHSNSAMAIHQLKRGEQQWHGTRGWSRGVGLLVLIGLLGLPGWGTAPLQGQDLLQQPRQSPQALEPSRHVTRPGPYGHLPLSFEANQGQTNDQVQFLARGPGYTLFLTAREAVFNFRPPVAHGQRPTGFVPRPGAVQDTPDTARAVVRMQLLGANSAPQVVGLEELPGKANYFIGNDPQQWRTHVPTYAKVQYAAVYPGVDLVYYGQARQLEYDFVVAPGADPAVITLGFEGVDHVDVDAQGDLVLATASRSLRFQKPVIYQEADGRRQAIAGGYIRKGLHQVGFHVAAYDVARPLVIDPVLSYATYLGGRGGETGFGIAVDAAGAAYVTGITTSADFPTVDPLQPALDGFADAFVVKLTADGAALVYATYLGGSGVRVDQGQGIAVDATGAAYVKGFTFSPDFPTVHPLQPALGGGVVDAFVAKLTADGAALVYATYLGGSGDDRGTGIAVDADGAAYVTGSTCSADFPTVHPLQPTFGGGGNCSQGGTPGGDAFVAKLTADGAALVYATYLGGSDDENSGASGIAVDAAGQAYVTGSTTSADFPTVHPLQLRPPALSSPTDAFAAKLRADGSALVYATYLGGSSADAGTGIAVDASGAAYLTGFTFSPDFPTVHPLQPTLRSSVSSNAFVAKFTANGAALVYSTYLGGCSAEVGFGIAVDAVGAAYVTGQTSSPDFPATPEAFQTTLGGGGSCGQRLQSDAFVAKIAALTFAGTPGKANCHGKSVSALAQQYGGLAAAAAALGFPSVQALQDAIREFCEE
jgi:Beta-propeller repeat